MLNKALLSSPKEFRVSIGTQTYCTASVNKSSAMPGDLVTVTVRSNTGYGNVKVGVSPSVEVAKVNETTFTFVMPVTDVVVSASASVLDFRISVSKTGQGTVTVKSLAKYGEVVTVSAYPSKGYELSSVTASGVTLSGSGDTRTFKMPAKDVTVNVTFAELPSASLRLWCNNTKEMYTYGVEVFVDGISQGAKYFGESGRTLYYSAKVKSLITMAFDGGDPFEISEAVGVEVISSSLSSPEFKVTSTSAQITLNW